MYWGGAFPNPVDDHLWFNTVWPEHAQIPQVQNASRIDSMEQISETQILEILGKLALYP